ncbi:Transcription elongation factor 1-like protein [Armadillidium vulgare]|nr:Transcription elongation factor 1-like protein [Armadillidium vulgare]
MLNYKDKPRNTGRVSCRVCLEDFQCAINYLSEAVDVYNEWIDACESCKNFVCHFALIKIVKKLIAGCKKTNKFG